MGDVQGCRDALSRLLDRLRFDPGSDQLFLTGDVVNKGPDSAGAIRLAIELGARSVLGNHDAHLLDVVAGRRRLRSKDTFGEILEAKDREVLIDWIRGLPIAMYLDGLLLIHAGVPPGKKNMAKWAGLLNRLKNRSVKKGRSLFDQEPLRFALSVRSCTKTGTQAVDDWPPPGPPFKDWWKFYSGKETIVFGHHARQGLLLRPKLRGLDTGCAYGGDLTAWIAEEDRIVRVPAKK